MGGGKTRQIKVHSTAETALPFPTVVVVVVVEYKYLMDGSGWVVQWIYYA